MSQSILAFDYGKVRIGVAVAINGEVSAVDTIKTVEIWQQLTELLQRYKPYKLVVGLPRSIEGNNDTQQTKLSREFAKSLQKRAGLQVELQDEAMSTQRANASLQPNMTITQKKAVVDQVAAKIILQDYLQQKNKNNK